MNKDDVINRVKSQNFPAGSYVVFGSGPFAALGIREVNDIDLYVSKELYKELEKRGWTKIHKGSKDEPLTHELFEAHDNWDFSPYNPSFKDVFSRAVDVEGVVFASIEDVRKWKESSGRQKDIADMKLIDEYQTIIIDSSV